MVKIQLDELLQKEMDRKAFLKHAGIAFVAFIGVTSLVNRFTSVANQSFGSLQTPSKNLQSSGYGMSVYNSSTAGR